MVLGDRLSTQVRAAEIEIDNVYKSNLLMQRSFAVAAWNLLGVIEDQIFQLIMFEAEKLTRFRFEALTDNLLFIMRQPIYWLKISCAPGGRIPDKYTVADYKAASELLRLATEYNDFYKLFTYASRGLIDVRLDAATLVPIGNIADDCRYEAYNRLIKPVNLGFTEDVLFDKQDEIRRKILPTLRPQGEKFLYEINPSLVAFTIDALQPIFNQRFSLPEHWTFLNYSISDFKKVFNATTALAFLQYSARVLAAQAGCPGGGFAASLMITRKYELINRLVRYTGLNREVIKSITYDLTLGSNSISDRQADPTQQPIIPLTEDEFGIMPQLWINNAAERNFVVLLNKLPTKRHEYLSLVGLKEQIMRDHLKEGMVDKAWRTWFGRVPASGGLPDIDLAVIDDRERMCLLLELKWFIDPAEPRELLEKSEEITKGISQLIKLRDAFNSGHDGLLTCLNVNSKYSLALAVISANWIGLASAQHANVPVIREYHLLKKIASVASLRALVAWLQARKYLPQEGVDYDVIWTESSVGRWKTKWYGIKPKLEDIEFLPL